MGDTGQMPLIQLLDARRAELGMGWPAVAKKLGVDQSMISRWRSGSIPSADRYDTIADFLGVDVDVVWRSLPATFKVRRRAHGAVGDPRVDELARSLEELRRQVDGSSGNDEMPGLRALVAEVAELRRAIAQLEQRLAERPEEGPPAPRKSRRSQPPK